MNQLTQDEIQDLLILLNRVTVTGMKEAIALLKIAEKLENQLKEYLNNSIKTE
jgi:hypothetical protein